jgi:hypothetical protein
MTTYKDVLKYKIDGNLARFTSEVGSLVDDVKVPLPMKHVDVFSIGQELELEEFCTLHNLTDAYNIIITAWGE